MDDTTELNYPLQWPAGVSRTQSPGPSAFDRKRTVEQARVVLFEELRRLGAERIILSTNIALRQDGFPYSNRRPADDKGVAVYFTLKSRRYCMPCDRWDRIACNIYAVAKHIEAMRGQNRWGVGSVEQAFQGYAALPAPTMQRPWREVMEYNYHAEPSSETLKDSYRILAKLKHPDNGGSDEAMAELNRAYQQAKEELGL